jgi:hypothetical protein
LVSNALRRCRREQKEEALTAYADYGSGAEGYRLVLQVVSHPVDIEGVLLAQALNLKAIGKIRGSKSLPFLLEIERD